MRVQKQYDFQGYCEIDTYVRRHFTNLNSSVFHLYHTGLPYLERILNVGLYGKVIAPAKKWALVSGLTEKTALKAIKESNSAGIIENTPGNGKKRLCNIIRRKSISELQKTIEPEILNKEIPEQAEGILERLNKIPVIWNGEQANPSYSLAKTGRIYMSRPNLQSTPSKERFQSLNSGIPKNWQLVECDYKAAEPTILFHFLREANLLKKNINPEDIYQKLASLRGIERSTAKRDFLSLVYSPRQKISIPEAWNIPQNHEIYSIVDSINQYRHALWQKGAPSKNQMRYVETLTGRKIQASKREKIHRGKLLSWHLQGSLADIFLNVLNRVLDEHENGNLKFCLQLHDSIIAALPKESADTLKLIFEEETQKAGIGIKATEVAVTRAVVTRVTCVRNRIIAYTPLGRLRRRNHHNGNGTIHN